MGAGNLEAVVAGGGGDRGEDDKLATHVAVEKKYIFFIKRINE